MPISAHRPKTPAVEPNQTSDTTQPEPAPPVKRTPVQTPPHENVRSRKATLVSPIPALLAASMSEFHEERADSAAPQAVDARVDATSRFEAADQNALLADTRDTVLSDSDEDSDYIVEVEDTKTRR
jgi:hypothetical protein